MLPFYLVLFDFKRLHYYFQKSRIEILYAYFQNSVPTLKTTNSHKISFNWYKGKKAIQSTSNATWTVNMHMHAFTFAHIWHWDFKWMLTCFEFLLFYINV